MVLEKTLESPLHYKEIKPVHPQGNQSWIFIGRTDAEAETPIICSPDVKNWLIGKDSDVGRDGRQEERGNTEDEMVLWPHQLDGHEFEQAPGVGDGQGSLACCSPWGRKESDMTEWLSWTELKRKNEVLDRFSVWGWWQGHPLLRRQLQNYVRSMEKEFENSSGKEWVVLRIYCRTMNIWMYIWDFWS